jgi:hypothetical protein
MDLFKAWISSAANYGQFRRLIPDHTDFPDAYDEWLYLANEQVTHMIKQGFVVTKVTIRRSPNIATERVPTTTPSLLMTSQT